MKVSVLGLKISKAKRPGDRHLEGKTLRVSKYFYDAIKKAAEKDGISIKKETEKLVATSIMLETLIGGKDPFIWVQAKLKLLPKTR